MYRFYKEVFSFYDYFGSLRVEILKVAHLCSSAHRDADGPAKQLNSHIVSRRFFQDGAGTGRVTTLMAQDD